MSYHFIPQTLEDLAIPLDQVHAFPGNARLGRVNEIAHSIRLHGQFRAIVVNRRDVPEHDGPGAILAGNHTWLAMDRLRGQGATHIAVTWVDVDREKAVRINLVDNKVSDDAAYDVEQLVAQLEALPNLDGTGYAEQDLGELLAQLESSTQKDEAAVPDGAARDASAPKAKPIKVVLMPHDISTVERALLATGEVSRPVALLCLCQAYLEAHGDGERQ